MKVIQGLVFLALLFAQIESSPAYPTGLGVREEVRSGQTRAYHHPDMVILQEGFHAKTGSDVRVQTGMELLQMSESKQVGSSTSSQSNARVAMPHSRELSGVVGTDSMEVKIGLGTSLPNPTNYYAISWMEIREKKNHPCEITLRGAMVDSRYPGEGRILARVQLSKCKTYPLQTKLDAHLVGFDSLKTQFIRGTQVCLGKSNFPNPLPQEVKVGDKWKIKGIRLRGAKTLAGREGVIVIDKIDESKGTNCPNFDAISGPGDASSPGWSNWVECGLGQLVTGLTLYHWKNKWFTGMKLHCKAVRQLSGPVPIKDNIGY